MRQRPRTRSVIVVASMTTEDLYGECPNSVHVIGELNHYQVVKLENEKK